jgi:hypothetical protein
MRKRFSGSIMAMAITVAAAISEFVGNSAVQAAVEVPQFRYDPSWPKPLLEGWVLGSVGSVCLDAHDHVFVVTRGEPAPKERNLAMPAPRSSSLMRTATSSIRGAIAR